MATNREEIQKWFEEGKQQGATHMIIVCDTYDYEDYPKYVYDGQDVRDIQSHCNSQGMQKVMEVYNLSYNMAEQLIKPRNFEY